MNKARFEAWRVLVGLWPKLLAYGMSFAVIGIMWQNHHALFRLVAPAVSIVLYVGIIAYFLVPRGADTDLDQTGG